MRRILLGVLAVVLLPFTSGAQQAAAPEKNPVSNAVRRIVERQSKNMIAAAEAMPAEKYGFKATADQMSFGHLIIHAASANNFLCSGVSGTPAPAEEKLAETDPKDKLVAALKASVDYCTQALAKVDDSNLSEPVPFFGDRKVSRATALIVITDAYADHYGMAAIYLRLNGLVPPTAQAKKD
jgi:uncharacterized damage-inducible protein DinB